MPNEIKKKAEERLKRTNEIFLVPFDKIVIDEDINNGRIDFGDLAELAESIKESGLRIPILVKKSRGEDQYVLVQGKRRLKAIEMLIANGIEFAGVKCFLAPQNYSIENSLFDQIIMNDGKPYSNLEQGIVFTQLVDRGFEIKEIAKKVAKSVTHIGNCIEIAFLPKAVRNLVAAGSVSGLTAVELSKIVKNDDELIEKLKDAIVNAPTTLKGQKKKVTSKNIKQIAYTSPFKKLEEVRIALRIKNVSNDFTEFIDKLIPLLKSDEPIESIANLFK